MDAETPRSAKVGDTMTPVWGADQGGARGRPQNAIGRIEAGRRGEELVGRRHRPLESGATHASGRFDDQWEPDDPSAWSTR